MRSVHAFSAHMENKHSRESLSAFIDKSVEQGSFDRQKLPRPKRTFFSTANPEVRANFSSEPCSSAVLGSFPSGLDRRVL